MHRKNVNNFSKKSFIRGRIGIIFAYQILTTMTIINSEKINQVDFIQGRKGEYQAIVKVQAGFMTTVEDLGIKSKWESGARWKRAIDVFRGFKKGALQTIEFKAEGTDHWITVFARSGKTIKLMDTQLFEDMKVGDINQDWSNTNLYSQTNYRLCNARTWEDKAFVNNF